VITTAAAWSDSTPEKVSGGDMRSTAQAKAAGTFSSFMVVLSTLPHSPIVSKKTTYRSPKNNLPFIGNHPDLLG
jgi:hypothetical protein